MHGLDDREEFLTFRVDFWLVLGLNLLDRAVIVHENKGALILRVAVALGALVAWTEIALRTVQRTASYMRTSMPTAGSYLGKVILDGDSCWPLQNNQHATPSPEDRHSHL